MTSRTDATYPDLAMQGHLVTDIETWSPFGAPDKMFRIEFDHSVEYTAGIRPGESHKFYTDDDPDDSDILEHMVLDILGHWGAWFDD